MPYGQWAAHDAYDANIPISDFVAIEFWAMAIKFLCLQARTELQYRVTCTYHFHQNLSY